MAAVKMAAALLFAAPALPLLFMGEEYGETSPFQFFTSYLGSGARRGRARRAGPPRVRPIRLVDHPARSRQIRGLSALAPEPSLAGAPRHRELREYYRRWLALRRSHPALGARGKERAQCEIDASGSILTLHREAPDGSARLPGRQPHQHRAALRAALGRLARTCSTARTHASPATGWAGRWPCYQAVLYEVSRRV